jgi:hypothetical protein
MSKKTTRKTDTPEAQALLGDLGGKKEDAPQVEPEAEPPTVGPPPDESGKDSLPPAQATEAQGQDDDSGKDSLPPAQNTATGTSMTVPSSSPAPPEGMETAGHSPPGPAPAVQEQLTAPRPDQPQPELPSSIESILDKPPLGERIKQALALVDRVDRQKLCKEVGAPIAEFGAAVIELIEAKQIKEDAISTPPVLYLPLSEKERKQHKEDVATAKGDDRFLALERIHDCRTYREDYRSWDDFLYYELGYENPHDFWEKEKRRVAAQRLLDQRGIKFRIPPNKQMLLELARVRDKPELFVAAVAQFQALPEKRQIAKELRGIVDRLLDQHRKLASLRQFVPDATEEELAALAPVYATDHRWRRWYPETDRQLRERVEASGRPIRDCMFEIAQEIKSLPRDTVLLSVARGADLVPLVNDLMRLQREWQRQHEQEEKRKKRLAEGVALKLYDPDTGRVTDKPAGKTKTQVGTHTSQSVVLGPDGNPLSSRVSVVGGSDASPGASPDPKDPDDDGDGGTTVYDASLTGQFAVEGEHKTLTAEGLADLLRDMADALDDGEVITQPSSLTVRPAARQEQSA